MTRLLAEWETQSSVMIVWPHITGDFGDQLATVETTYQLIAKVISEKQKLIIACKDFDHQKQIQNQLNFDLADIQFAHTSYNDIWLRDTAPIIIETDHGIELLDFKFNGWGGKYPCEDDSWLSQRLHEQGLFGETRLHNIDMVLEGGSLESDGQGTLLTTRQCLLNPNRNPSMTQKDIETELNQSLGVERILWLDQNNLEGDDTDAHIDTLARFCNPDTIAYTSCVDPQDRHFKGLKNMESQLQKFKTTSGKNYRLVPLPLPKAIYSDANNRLPANYANFLIINNAVLIPAYDDPIDVVVSQKLSVCFPNREIIPIPCIPLVHQYGSLHCMTMQSYPDKPNNRQPEP